MEVRSITRQSVGAATESVASAFRGDPVWSVALAAADPSDPRLRDFWRLYVEGALRYETVFASAGCATVSVWIPPGGTELSDEQEAAMHRLVEQWLDPVHVAALSALWERFEEHHPRQEEHAYLGLLATRPDQAGHGYGQEHLAHDLGRWDAAGVPTYLESSNPRNNDRYRRQGYRQIGAFETVLDRAVVTTMWRPVGG